MWQYLLAVINHTKTTSYLVCFSRCLTVFYCSLERFLNNNFCIFCIVVCLQCDMLSWPNTIENCCGTFEGDKWNREASGEGQFTLVFSYAPFFVIIHKRIWFHCYCLRYRHAYFSISTRFKPIWRYCRFHLHCWFFMELPIRWQIHWWANFFMRRPPPMTKP